MNDWFTVEKIDAHTFVISEYRHPENTHCYLVCGSDRALLIDTGLGISRIGETVSALTMLPVIAVTTHVHWDHIGGHRDFRQIGVHERESDWLSVQFPLPAAVVKQNLLKGATDFPGDFCIADYEIPCVKPSFQFRDGDCFDLGNRIIRAVHTPGHSPGHCCFYETTRKYLYSGDLIYRGCLDMFYPSTDPRLFYRSIEKVRTLAIERIFPGHHTLSLSAAIIGEISAALGALSAEGKLMHGSGLFDFGEFQLHI